jgi:hypothetical protein
MGSKRNPCYELYPPRWGGTRKGGLPGCFTKLCYHYIGDSYAHT